MENEVMIGNINPSLKTLRYGRPTFLIVCTVEIPYPKSFTYRIEASAIGTAINRAIVKMRKEDLKHRKIKEVRVKATKLTN